MEEIRCEQVTFRYPETEEAVFQNCSLALAPGITALWPDRRVLTRERLEQADNVPLAFLKHKQALYREALNAQYDARDRHWLN